MISRCFVERAAFAALSLLFLSLVGCSSVPEKSDDNLAEKLWPRPPALPRYSYEFVLRNAASIQDPEQLALMRKLTGEDTKQRTEKSVLNKPFDIVAYQGRIYVTDTAEACVWVFDIPRRRLYQFGRRLEGALRKPLGIDVDRHHRVYVVDQIQKRLVIYDSLGLYQGELAARELVHPSSVAVSPYGENIYIVDMGGIDSDQHRVLHYNAKGEQLRVIGRRGAGDGEFNLPLDATVDVEGNLYVLDAGNFRVQVFDSAGNYLRQFGGVGRSFGQFSRPRSIAVDNQGNVYVSDASFGNVQIFNNEGRLLMFIGEAGTQPAPGRYPLLAGVTVDETNRIYLVDQFFSKVEVMRRLRDSESEQLLQQALDQKAAKP